MESAVWPTAQTYLRMSSFVMSPRRMLRSSPTPPELWTRCKQKQPCLLIVQSSEQMNRMKLCLFMFVDFFRHFYPKLCTIQIIHLCFRTDTILSNTAFAFFLFHNRDVEIIEVTDGNTVMPSTLMSEDDPAMANEEPSRSTIESFPTSSALQLNKPSTLSQEDPVKMMDSILKESGAISQNINLLGK